MDIKKILTKIYKLYNNEIYLGGQGERVDIQYHQHTDSEMTNINRKLHYRRYEFVREYIPEGSVCGDFACGTGYGSVMLAEKSKNVLGVDINPHVIRTIKRRYKKVTNVKFIKSDLLDLRFKSLFDIIVSFETLEHFVEDDIIKLLTIYNKALKYKGKLICSMPYMEGEDGIVPKSRFHLSFQINKEKIVKWLKETNYKVELIKYQDYKDGELHDDIKEKAFIICIAQKSS